MGLTPPPTNQKEDVVAYSSELVKSQSAHLSPALRGRDGDQGTPGVILSRVDKVLTDLKPLLISPGGGLLLYPKFNDNRNEAGAEDQLAYAMFHLFKVL